MDYSKKKKNKLLNNNGSNTTIVKKGFVYILEIDIQGDEAYKIGCTSSNPEFRAKRIEKSLKEELGHKYLRIKVLDYFTTIEAFKYEQELLNKLENYSHNFFRFSTLKISGKTEFFQKKVEILTTFNSVKERIRDISIIDEDALSWSKTGKEIEIEKIKENNSIEIEVRNKILKKEISVDIKKNKVNIAKNNWLLWIIGSVIIYNLGYTILEGKGHAFYRSYKASLEKQVEKMNDRLGENDQYLVCKEPEFNAKWWDRKNCYID